MDRIKDHGTTGGERADAVDHCLSAIARLSNEVQDASSYLPAYDQRTYGDAIKALNHKLQDVRTASAPRSKFSFKSGSLFATKKNESAISLNDAAELANQQRRNIPGFLADRSNTSSYVNTPADLPTPANEKADEQADTEAQNNDAEASQSQSGALLSPSTSMIRKPSFSQSTAVSISNHERAHIVLPTAASHATSSGTVSNLTRSIIDMSPPTTGGAPFAALSLRNISSSLVICGHVAGAAHLTNIHDSIVLVASRQFRMHDSSNCDVYLLAASRPIIEDCAGIRFAPLPRAYMTAHDEPADNKWAQVDDFKWLRSEQSPHWRELPPEERIADDVWRDVVPGGPDLGVEDILRAVRVPK